MTTSYCIQPRQDAKPYALITPRQIAVHLLPKVNWHGNCNACMEEIGVISKTNKPAEWCAGIVSTPKQNGNVRIFFVDLTKLNESVCK